MYLNITVKSTILAQLKKYKFWDKAFQVQIRISAVKYNLSITYFVKFTVDIHS